MEVLHAALVVDLHADVEALGAIALVPALGDAVRPGAHRHGEEMDYVTERELEIGGLVLLGYDYEILFVVLQKADKRGRR